MYLELLILINKHEIDHFDKPLFNKPATDEIIESLVTESIDKLQYQPCDEYLELLQLTNGFEWEHMIYDTKEFIEANLQHRETCQNDTLIIFGSVGNMHLYTYNTIDETFIIADLSCDSDDTLCTFDKVVTEIYKDRVELYYTLKNCITCE